MIVFKMTASNHLGCDKKCNGCMEVNGETLCHSDNKCMLMGKRSGPMKPFEVEMQDRIVDYPIVNALAVK